MADVTLMTQGKGDAVELVIVDGTVLPVQVGVRHDGRMFSSVLFGGESATAFRVWSTWGQRVWG